MSGPPLPQTFPAFGPPGTAPLARVPVLLASAQEADQSAVADLLRGTRYVVAQAGSLRDTMKILSDIVFPIILYDASFDAADWHLGLRKMMSTWRVPSVLLIANRYDAELTGDSLRHGAFDVLVRPLTFADVLPALEFAYIHWKLGLTKVALSAIGHDRRRLIDGTDQVNRFQEIHRFPEHPARAQA